MLEPDIRRQSHAGVLLLISVCLAIFTGSVSSGLHPRFEHTHEVVHDQFAILHGEPYLIDGQPVAMSQFQSRVFFPLLLSAVTGLGVMSQYQAFALLRFSTAIAAFGAFLFATARWVSPKIAGAGAILLTYGMIFTFNHGWEHPTDFPDVMFFVGSIWLSLNRRRWLLIPWLALATLNHQTAAFGGVIWFFLWGLSDRLRVDWKESFYAGCLMLGSVAESSAVKTLWYHEHGPGVIGDGRVTITHFIEFLHKPSPYGWPLLLVAMATPVIAWLQSNRAEVCGEVRRLVWAAVAVIVIGSPLAFWSELRSVFLPPLVIATFAATLAEGRKQGSLLRWTHEKPAS